MWYMNLKSVSTCRGCLVNVPWFPIILIKYIPLFITCTKKPLFYHCVALCSRILATILNLFKFGRKKKSLSALEIGIISLVLTLNAPNNHSVYSSPTEKINRKIVDIKKVRMAKGLTPTMVTKAKEPNMAVQIRPDSLGSSSVTANTQSSENKCKHIMYELLFTKKKS